VHFCNQPPYSKGLRKIGTFPLQGVRKGSGFPRTIHFFPLLGVVMYGGFPLQNHTAGLVRARSVWKVLPLELFRVAIGHHHKKDEQRNGYNETYQLEGP
jgi:hypothetical protein